MKVRVALGGLVVLALATGCTRSPVVTRVYDGRVVPGRFVPPEAYAAFLRGVLAEEGGDLAGARAAYETALEEDDDDPMLLARLGEVACRMQGSSARKLAARSFERARELDPAYAGTFAAEARCALTRGDTAAANESARRAVAADETNAELQALAVRAEARRPASPEARARAIALTSAHGERVSAWEALLAWGRSHHDDALVARALAGLGRLAPLRLREVEGGVIDLLTRKQLADARLVAAALAEAPRESGHLGPRDAVVARLAVDEAILRGDAEGARRRAARGHVSLAEVAARAVALEQRALASVLAEELLAADPTAIGPIMVASALAPKGARAVESKPNEAPPALCVYVLADRLAATSGVEAARAFMARVAYAPPTARDPVATALALALEGRGVLTPEQFPKELRASTSARSRRRVAPRDSLGG